MAKKLEWTEGARADLRRIDRQSAMRILEGLATFLFTDEGDVKVLKGSAPENIACGSEIIGSGFTISETPF